jgi:cell division inhibitor SepF
MNFWGRALVYLGLREEAEDEVDWQALEDADVESVPQSASGRISGSGAGGGARVVAPVTRVAGQTLSDVSNVRPLRSGLDVSSERVAVVQVQVFDDVETIGARYRLRNPVLFDVSGCSREVARRVVDFVSGLTYATRGTLRRTAPKAFLLCPEGVDIPLDERRRLAQLGYDVNGVAR